MCFTDHFHGAGHQLFEYENKFWWRQRRNVLAVTFQVKIVYEDDMPLTAVVARSKDSEEELDSEFKIYETLDDQSVQDSQH